MVRKSFDDRRRETAAKLAALMLANAFIFQEQLASLDARVRPIRRVMAEVDFITSTASHWKLITDEIDYVPIFAVARDILLALPASADADRAVKRLATRALEIVQKKAALRHDLMGRIYHLLLLEAKYLGTYYTSVPAATLLLKLAMDVDRWPEVDWSSPDALKQFRVADLACGTGTLLMAASQALTDNYIKFARSTGHDVGQSEIQQLHRLAIEEMLHGYDVLPSAVHLTASTLAMLAPDTTFSKMRLYSLLLGQGKSGQIYLGSIDYISSNVIATQLDLMSPAEGALQAGEMTGSSVAALPELSLCVMNPPFVRSVGGNLLFGSVPDRRGQLQKELSRRLKENGVAASSTAGLGSVFTALGDRHVRPGGRLALVLPAAILSGVAWGRTRELLAHRYVVETIVTSHDPQRWNFSENTELSEVLIVARKRTHDEPDPSDRPTQFINLWRNPDTSAHALALGEIVSRDAPVRLGGLDDVRHDVRELVIGGEKFGETIAVPWGSFRHATWLGGTFAQTNLVRASILLSQGELYSPGQNRLASVPIARLGALALLGPDRRDIYDAFLPAHGTSSYPAFWGHSADDVRSMGVAPTKWLLPRTEPAAGRPRRDAALLWGRAGAMMIAERSRLNTQRVLATRLPEPALSNVWWPVRLKHPDAEAEKIICLWLNSTPGLLLLLAHRVPTQGPWVQFKKPTIEGLPILDPRRLDSRQRAELSACYDALSRDAMAPMSEMATDPTRREIDRVLARTLGLPGFDWLRAQLSAEPIIAVRRSDGAASVDEEQGEFQFDLA